MQLISERTKAILEQLIQNGFIGNRYYDRAYSWTEVKGLPNLADYFHTQAHEKAGVEADKFIEYMHKRNASVIFLETPIDDTEYETIGEVIIRLLDYELESEEQLFGAAKEVWNIGDLQTFSEIQAMIMHIKEHINQLSLLSDQIELYGDAPKSWLALDARLSKVLKIEGGED